MTSCFTNITQQNLSVYVRRFVLFCALLMSGGLLIFNRSYLLLLIFLLGLFYFRVISFNLKPKNHIVYIWLFFVLLATLQFTDMLAIIIRFANFFVALIILNIYSRTDSRDLTKDLIFIFQFMAIQSVSTVLLAYLFPSIFMTVDISGASYKTFLYILNYHTTVGGMGQLVRPDGFFFEPGVFQFYLNIYLFLVVSLNRPFKELFLAILAVLLTQSTTGLIIAAIIILFFFKQIIMRFSYKLRVLLFYCAIISLYPLYFIVNENISQKMFGKFSGSSSARLYDLNIGTNLIKEHPFTGIGFSHSDYIRESRQLAVSVEELAGNDIYGRSTSNGLVYLFYSIGIPLGLVLFIGLFRQRFFKHRLLFGTILALTLIGEALIFTPVFLMFAFSGLTRKKGS